MSSSYSDKRLVLVPILVVYMSIRFKSLSLFAKPSNYRHPRMHKFTIIKSSSAFLASAAGCRLFAKAINNNSRGSKKNSRRVNHTWRDGVPQERTIIWSVSIDLQDISVLFAPHPIDLCQWLMLLWQAHLCLLKLWPAAVESGRRPL